MQCITKTKNLVFLLLLNICLSYAALSKAEEDTVPVTITPWSYKAIRCDQYWGPMSDELAIASAFAKITYGADAQLSGSAGWGTRQSPVFGPCGSSVYFPSFDKNNVEVANFNHYSVLYKNNTLKDGISISRTRSSSCPEGTTPIGSQLCKFKYVAVAPHESPPTSCPVGNPVDTGTGAKIQKEIDIDSHGSGQIGFDRTYSNLNKTIGGFWYNPYQKSLRIIEPQKIEIVRAKSASYTTKAIACTSGVNNLKTKISDNWTKGSTTRYVNNTCQIVRNNKVIKNIPIVPGAQSTEVYFKPGAIQLVREDGSILNFGLSTGDQYSGLSGERGQLIAVSDAAPVAWRYKTSNGDIEDYNADGKLLSITNSTGLKQELFYDSTNGSLIRVKDSTSREITFAYTGNQLSSITVDGNKTTSYLYNAQGLISKVIRPDNTERIYHYEDVRFPTHLTGITDERNKRYATWAYDAQGRAISSEHAGGADKTLLSFNADGSTTVTNALNKQTIYRFDDIAGVRRVVKVEGQPTTNCAGANQNYTYTPEGWLESKTDWKGIKTTFQYNASGQEISRTEAFGTADARTITTEWHPAFYVKTKVTEPGKETTFSYDVNGRLENQTIRAVNN